jgi:hypothetical protein
MLYLKPAQHAYVTATRLMFLARANRFLVHVVAPLTTACMGHDVHILLHTIQHLEKISDSLRTLMT